MRIPNKRFAATAPILAAVVLSSAHAGATQEVKIPHTPPLVQDIKTPAPVLPAKEAGPARQPVSIEQVMAHAKSHAGEAKLPGKAASAKFARPSGKTYFSQQADGSVWAMGDAYKAQFNSAGTTYFPNMGAQAPKLYPLGFQLSGASVGDTAITFASDAAAVLSSDAVKFERGGLTELYSIRADSIDQQFVFATLPGTGDLVVRLALTTELAGSNAADGFHFSNELGYVSYGKAVAIDAAGQHFDAQTTLDGGSIEIRLPASAVGAAVLPLTIDPVIATFTVSTTLTVDYASDVAYDASTGRYLICWEDAYSGTDHDVWAQEYDGSGNAIGGSLTTIDFTTSYWANPHCANNFIAANFLVAAEVGSYPSRAIWGATYAASSAAVGPQFAISNEPNYDCHNCDVGGDPVSSGPTYYLVVWERDFAAGDDDIHAQQVNANSTLNGGLILVDNSSATLDFNPTVSKGDGSAPFSTQNWTVTWTREFNPGVDYDIWASQVHWDGTITYPTYSVDFSTGYDYYPSASTVLDGNVGDRDYMVVYNRFDGVSDGNIHARIYNGTGFQADADLSSLDTTPTQNQVGCCVDSDGANYAVAYTEQFSTSSFDYDMYVSTFSRVGSSIRVSEAHQLLDFTGDQSNTPQIASQHSAGGSGVRSMATWYNWDSTFTVSDVRAGSYDNAQFTSYCNPGVDTASCPCGNPPSGANRGCNNSSNTGGAQLSMTGNASLGSDTVQFTATGEKPTATSIFLQGNAANTGGATFGQGIRCVAGTLKRLYVKTASSGSATAPVGSDARVSVRSAALGDSIGPGEPRFYMVYYRDPTVLGGCPFSSTFNATQSGAVGWIP